MASQGNARASIFPQEIELQIARDSVPSVLRVRVRYIGGNKRAEYAWILEALNGGDFTSTISWYCMGFAQDDVVGEVREKTVLRVDLWKHQEEAYPLDKYVPDAVYLDTPQIPIAQGFLGTIRHIEVHVLNLYHMGEGYGHALRSPDTDSHLERYTVRLRQASDGEISLQSIEREILNVCNALEMYAEDSPAVESVRQHRAETMQVLLDQITYQLANMAQLQFGLPYLIGMIISDWNGDAPRFQEEVVDSAGTVMAMCGTRFDAAKVYKVAKNLPWACWDIVDDENDDE